MNNGTVLITGANGFIAKAIALSLSTQGFEVIGTSRTPHKDHPHFSKIIPWKFDTTFDIESLNCSAVIHAAYPRDPEQMELAKEGTIKLAQQFLDKGIRSQYLLSTLSALTQNQSPYAISKRKIEKVFQENKLSIIRLGLVIGNGGLFERMEKIIRFFPIIPVIGGENKIKVTKLESILNYFSKILNEDSKSDEVNLFEKEQISNLEILKMIAQKNNQKRIFISLPWQPFYYSILVLEKILPFDLPISSANILGAAKNNVE